jgi:hypothetical protein
MSKARIIADYAGTGAATDLATQAELNAVSTVASAALPKAGGTMSGDLVPATPMSHRNHLINGDFQVAQRGTSFTSTDGGNNYDKYTLDRWYISSQGNDIIDVTQSSTAPTNQLYSIALDIETANKNFGIYQIIENKNCVGLIGNTVTLSFKAKVSNTRIDSVKAGIIAWSGSADVVTSDIINAWNGDGVTPTLITNATFENTPTNLNVTTSWASYSVTATIDTSSTTNVIVGIFSDDLDTTVGDILYITDVQLEQGSTATPFERRSYGDELRRCQRYFHQQGRQGSSGYENLGVMTAHSTTDGRLVYYLPTSMRTFPELESNGDWQTITGVDITVISLGDSGGNSAVGLNFAVASGLTASSSYLIRSDNDVDAYVQFDAEL